MAFYNNENLPNGIFFTKYFAKYQINPDKLPKTYVSVPKWQIFAKYGHTDCDKLLQVVPTYVATSWDVVLGLFSLEPLLFYHQRWLPMKEQFGQEPKFVNWLWEETHVLKVVGLNPSTVYRDQYYKTIFAVIDLP